MTNDPRQNISDPAAIRVKALWFSGARRHFFRSDLLASK
jgi:hypothetical protein